VRREKGAKHRSVVFFSLLAATSKYKQSGKETLLRILEGKKRCIEEKGRGKKVFTKPFHGVERRKCVKAARRAAANPSQQHTLRSHSVQCNHSRDSASRIRRHMVELWIPHLEKNVGSRTQCQAQKATAEPSCGGDDAR